MSRPIISDADRARERAAREDLQRAHAAYRRARHLLEVITARLREKRRRAKLAQRASRDARRAARQ